MANPFEENLFGQKRDDVALLADRVRALAARITTLEAVPAAHGNRAGLQAAAGSSASTTFVNWPGGAVDVTITKRSAATALFFWLHTTFYITGAAGQVLFAVQDLASTTDHLLTAGRYTNELNSHKMMACSNPVSGLAVGAYTFRLRSKVGAVGPTLNTDANDFADLTVVEMPMGAT
jgi:hypothetical protein